MAWTVRTPDGSLDFVTLADVERAYRIGLVGADDELREADGAWMRAGAHPALRTAAPARTGRAHSWGTTAFALSLAIAAVVCLALGQWGLGLAVALALTLYLFRRTPRAVRPDYSRATRTNLLLGRARAGGLPASGSHPLVTTRRGKPVSSLQRVRGRRT